MGIQLDWKLEDEDRWEQVLENPAVVADRLRRARRARGWLIGAALTLALIAGAVIIRLDQARRARLGGLEAAVAAETLALRLGDRDAFLAAQSAESGWQTHQAGVFDGYQSLGARVHPDGEIVEMELDADRARVTVRETLDGAPYHVLWFYQLQDGVWRHIPPDPAAWGVEREYHTPHADFTFHEEDRQFVSELARRLNGWWQSACRVSLCADAPPGWKVQIEPDFTLEIARADYDPNTILIPSPLLGRVRLDRVPDPATLDALAELMAEHWARWLVTGEAEPFSETAWLEEEMAGWLRMAFDSEAGDVVPPLSPDADDSSVDWRAFAAYRLRAEAAFRRDGRGDQLAALVDPQSRDRMAYRPFVAFPIIPESIEVADVWENQTLRLALVRFTLETPPEPGTDRLEWSTIEAFRPVDGGWLHTVPRGEDWGDLQQDRDDYWKVTTRYFALEARSYSEWSTLHFQEDARLFRNRAASDLGVRWEDYPVVVLVVPPEIILTDLMPGEVADPPGTLRVVVTSPYATYFPAGSPDSYIHTDIGNGVIARMVEAQVEPFPLGHPITVALIRWEVANLFLDPAGIAASEAMGDAMIDFRLGPGAADRMPETLDGLWPPADGETSGVYGTRGYLAAQVLVELLVERFGPRAFPALVRGLRTARGMDEWLYRSLGIRADDIEAAWAARLDEAMAGVGR